MAILDYLNYVVPDVTKKSVPSFYSKDPLLDALMSKGKVVRSGGPNVRIVRIKGRPAEPYEITATQLGTPLINTAFTSQMTGDWSRYSMPLVFPHVERDRFTSKEEVSRWTKDKTTAAMQALRNLVSRQLYLGLAYRKDGVTRVLQGVGTLNGARTDITTSGFANGALRFQTPAAQAAASVTYLNETRVNDTTNDEDNWYNQFQAHNGIGVDFLDTCEAIKLQADTYDEGTDGISLGVVHTSNASKVSAAVRSYPGGGGNSAILYTPADVSAGKAVPFIGMAAGIKFMPNRWMTDTLMGETEPCYLLNPSTIEYWVNANNDFKVSKIVDFRQTTGQAADVGFVDIEIQFAVPGLLCQGCTSKA
jgi:hypothetical protein